MAAEAIKAARAASHVEDAEEAGETDDYTRGSVRSLWPIRRVMPWGHRLHPILVMRMTIRLGTLLTMLARRSFLYNRHLYMQLMTTNGRCLHYHSCLSLLPWSLIPLCRVPHDTLALRLDRVLMILAGTLMMVSIIVKTIVVDLARATRASYSQ